MAQPRILILRAPGTNCDAEAVYAFQLAGGLVESLHVNALLDSPRQVLQYQVICLPGGFSYGDDVAAGRILGNQIRHHLTDCLQEFKSAGKLILGICNGFQVLLKSGLLLPLEADSTAPATLAWNQCGKFEDRWVPLYTSGSKSIFFAGIDSMYLPVAHAEGRFAPRSEKILQDLGQNGQIALRYGARPVGETQLSTAANVPYPDNPNGSWGDVAGVCDATGRVCGLMPHPERHVDFTQHPRWTRRPSGEADDGLRVFRNAVGYFA